MRIVAGKHRGRKLMDCKNFKDLRPTTDANRENLFNIIFSSKKIKDLGLDITDVDFLDVFSGSGAVALEALSRGAKSASLIDINRQHLEVAKQNATTLKENNLEYFCLDIVKANFSKFKFSKPCNLIYLDPPYNKNLVAPAINNLIQSDAIKKNALIAIEHHQDEILDLDERKFTVLEVRKYKDTVFSFITLVAS